MRAVVNCAGIRHADKMKRTFALVFFGAVMAGPAMGEVVTYAPEGGTAQDQLVIYSTLDNRLAAPLISAFQDSHPTVLVRYEDLLAGEIAARVMSETRAGKPTADFVFSSAMDMQIKLANDGYAQAVDVPAARDWPVWANWQD